MFITVDHTVNGTLVQPLSVENLNYRAEMKIDSKKVLWENVVSLMVDRYKKENLTKLAKDSGVGPGTMTRIKDQETSVGVDVLEKLASVANVEPWQLLHPNMGKSALSTQNQPLALAVPAQAATNNVASLDHALGSLAAYLAQADDDTRTAAGGLLLALSKQPDNPAMMAALTALLTPSGFVETQRKAA